MVRGRLFSRLIYSHATVCMSFCDCVWPPKGPPPRVLKSARDQRKRKVLDQSPPVTDPEQVSAGRQHRQNGRGSTSASTGVRQAEWER
jgi:hypothetical protein